MFKSTLTFLFCKLSKELLFFLWKPAWLRLFFHKILPDSLVGSLLRNKRTCLRDGAHASVLPTQETSHLWAQEPGWLLTSALCLSHIHPPGLLMVARQQLRPRFEPRVFHARSWETRCCSAVMYDWHHRMLASLWIVSAIQTQASL